jgi:hypothetical protein
LIAKAKVAKAKVAKAKVTKNKNEMKSKWRPEAKENKNKKTHRQQGKQMFE